MCPILIKLFKFYSFYCVLLSFLAVIHMVFNHFYLSFSYFSIKLVVKYVN